MNLMSAQLPLWVEYVKALATPIVALITASLAGGIAYRQWITARNKLKLDLFDKRFKVYQAAVQLITETAGPEPVEWSKIVELSASFPSARWLLNGEISDYLATLETLASGTLFKPMIDLDSMDDVQKEAWVLKIGTDLLRIRSEEIAKLDALFESYLTVGH